MERFYRTRGEELESKELLLEFRGFRGYEERFKESILNTIYKFRPHIGLNGLTPYER